MSQTAFHVITETGMKKKTTIIVPFLLNMIQVLLPFSPQEVKLGGGGNDPPG